MNADGTGLTTVHTTLGYEYLIAPDWQPLPVNDPSAYPRPKSATPIFTPLVPAAMACASPNGVHAPPLSSGSCSPNVPWSTYLTLLVAGRAESVGAVRLNVLGTDPVPANDADVRIRLFLTNVMRASDRSDYTGEILGRIGIRLTDKQAGVASTLTRITIDFTATCTATTATTTGSDCNADTTANTLIPGVVKEGARAIWGLERMTVLDGGADGDAETLPGNALLATQGVFAP